jgi:hypothetical protein
MSWITVLLVMVAMTAAISGAAYLLRDTWPGFKNMIMSVILGVAGVLQAFDFQTVIAGLDPQMQGLFLLGIAIMQAALRAITKSPIFQKTPGV